MLSYRKILMLKLWNKIQWECSMFTGDNREVSQSHIKLFKQFLLTALYLNYKNMLSRCNPFMLFFFLDKLLSIPKYKVWGLLRMALYHETVTSTIQRLESIQIYGMSSQKHYSADYAAQQHLWVVMFQVISIL